MFNSLQNVDHILFAPSESYISENVMFYIYIYIIQWVLKSVWIWAGNVWICKWNLPARHAELIFVSVYLNWIDDDIL